MSHLIIKVGATGWVIIIKIGLGRVSGSREGLIIRMLLYDHDHVKRWLCDYVMSGTCCWSLLRSSLVLGRGGDGGRWTNGLILFGSSLILFGSSLILFGSSLILFGSSLILFGSSLILFGSSSTFGTSKRGNEESGWKKCLKIWACLKSKPVDWVSQLLPASYPSGKMC